MKKILAIYIRVVMFLFPIVIMPGVLDGLVWGKMWLALALGLIGLGLWLVGMLVAKEETVKYNFGLLIMLGIVVWATIGWWNLAPGVKYRSMVSISGLGMLTTALVWMFLWIQVASKEERVAQLKWITASGVVVLVTSLIVFLWPVAKLPFSWPKDNPWVTLSSTWSLTGSLMSELVLLTFLLVEWGEVLAGKLKRKDGGYIGEAVLTAVFFLGVMLSGYRLVKAGWVNLDGNTSWMVATESFKRKPLWGVGAGNFSEAFALWRPNSYNLTKYWSTGFNLSSSTFMQLWTELGLGVVVLLLIKIVGFLRQKRNWQWAKTLVMGVVVLLTPWNLILLWLMKWREGTGVWEVKKVRPTLRVGENGFNGAPWLLGIVMAVGVVWGGYWWVRVLQGDIYLRQSLLAASKNDGGSTYNQQIKAIAAMPYAGEYRRMYSQTNIALARTILENKEATADDREKASVLVQQAVREAKAALALDGMNSTYWSNLAVIYRQLAGVVDGSADWSYQSYQQAVALDPTNPVLTLDLGGLLFAAERVEEADRVFEQVVVSKSDYANGWYNWAYTAKRMGRLGDAVSRLSQAVALVPVDSGDYETASKELDAWKKELDEAIKRQQQQVAAQQQKAPETLKTPEPLPTAGQEEKVNVPASELEPPKVTPTVGVEATPTPVANTN